MSIETYMNLNDCIQIMQMRGITISIHENFNSIFSMSSHTPCFQCSLFGRFWYDLNKKAKLILNHHVHWY